MKYIENLSLENLTKIITNYELGGGLVINGRIEVYSTKKVNDEKKQVKLIENKFDTVFNTTNNNIIKMDCNDENEDDKINNSTTNTTAITATMTSSTNSNNNSTSNTAQKVVNNNNKNNINDSSIKTKKVLGDLIQTMNCSMVDYDFSELSPDSFVQTNINVAIQDINSHIVEITVQLPNFINNLWRDISDVMINLNQCEVYKLVDEAFIDEFENGMKWSFNYFFCSKEYKRVCYFTCIANSKYRKIDILGLNDDDDDDDDLDDDDQNVMDTSDGVADGDDSEEGDFYWN